MTVSLPYSVKNPPQVFNVQIVNITNKIKLLKVRPHITCEVPTLARDKRELNTIEQIEKIVIEVECFCCYSEFHAIRDQ